MAPSKFAKHRYLFCSALVGMVTMIYASPPTSYEQQRHCSSTFRLFRSDGILDRSAPIWQFFLDSPDR